MQELRLDYAIVSSLIVGAVGYLFWMMLMAARQKHMARLMKLTTWAIIVILVVVPVSNTIQKAAAWINGTVQTVEETGQKVAEVTEKVENVTESVKKEPKKLFWDFLRHQLRDPGKD